MADAQVPPTTREALAAHLDQLGVRQGTYHLFGAHYLDDAVVLDLRREGWVVFYSERGGEFTLRVHEEEADACADFLSRLLTDEDIFFDLVAGPSRADAADSEMKAWLRDRHIAPEELNPADWKRDDIPWNSGTWMRRYFMRISAIRRLSGSR